MPQFVNEEIRAFLLAVDAHIERPFRMDLIGEAVAVLSFNVQSGTEDLDAITNIQPIEEAINAAKKDTGLDVGVETTCVYDGPYYYETRMRRVFVPGLTKLQIFVPEKHDWALMKIARLLEKDIEDIIEVSETMGFSKRIFLKRFLEEMPYGTGRLGDLVFQFLAMMKELFGSDEAETMEVAVRRHKKWKHLWA